MSRSYKLPVIKDGGHAGKKLHSRRYRRTVNQIVKKYVEKESFEYWDEDTDDHIDKWSIILPHPYEITDPWDICDWWTWRKVTRWSDGFEWFGDLYSTNSEDVRKACRK